MAGNVDDVVHTAHDPEITVFISAGTVAGKVIRRNLRPVLLHIAIRVAVDGTRHPWPGLFDDQVASGSVGHGLAVHADDFGYNAGQGTGGGAGLGSDGAGYRADHDVAGFGLPPSVDDGAIIVADDFAIPHPGLGVDRLTYSPKQSQAIEPMFARPLLSPFDESANGSRCSVKNIDLMAIDNAPEAIGLGVVGRAFVH